MERGIEIVKTPASSPNAFAERFVRSIKSECLSRMIFFGQRCLDRTIREFVAHYHTERNHQGLGNRLLEEREVVSDGDVVRRERLGGLHSFYDRAA